MGRRRRSILRTIPASAGSNLPVSAGLVVEYYTVDSDNVVLTGARHIEQLLDISGNGNDTGAQETDGKHPDPLEYFNREYAEFDTDDSLELPSALYTVPAGNHTIFCVARRDTETGVPESIFSFTGVESTEEWYIHYGSSAGSISYKAHPSGFGTTTTSTGNTNTRPQIITAWREGTAQSVAVNGGTVTTNASGLDVTDITGGFLGRSGVSESYHLTGLFGAMIVYNRALTETERAQVETYLADKFGIYAPDAAWISDMTKPKQAIVHALTLNEDEAFANSSRNTCTLYLSAGYADNVTVVDNAVSNWYDESGYQNHFNNLTSVANRPAYDNTGSRNGLNVINFNNSNLNYDSSATLSSLLTLLTASYTIFTVANITTGNGTSTRSLIGFATSSSNIAYMQYTGNANTTQFKNGGTLNNTNSVDKFTLGVMTASREGTALYNRQNISTASNNTSGSSATATITVLRLGENGRSSNQWIGAINQVIIIRQAMTVAQRELVINALMEEWGIV